MKTYRRVLSVILAVLMLFGIFGFTSFAKGEKNGLKFDENGNFRIMHISDTHYTDFPFEESIAFIEKVLDDYNPDLVIFGGDNIKGWFDTSMQLGVKAAIDKLVAPVAERNIPFSFVYGNHDGEAYLCPKSMQTGFYGAYENCIIPDGYSSITGTGCGNITVKDSSGEKDIFNIWLFDSGTKTKINGSTVIEGVPASQIKIYTDKSNKLKNANGGSPLPAIAFQHFGIEKVTSLFDESENGYKCAGKSYVLKSGITDTVCEGVTGIENTRQALHLNKSCEIPDSDNGEYDAFVRQGDIFGLFFGHTHTNDFCGITEDNIILGATPSAGGFNISSRYEDENGVKTEARGVRVIDINEDALVSGTNHAEALSTFSVYYKDYFTDSIEKYPEKYKKLDEHSFTEWIKIEFEYLIAYLKSVFKLV